MAGLGKSKEGAMAGLDECKEGALGARSMRSLQRALMTKEASAKEQSEILSLKREARALRKRTPAEEARFQRIMREMNRTAADEEPQPAKRRKTVIKETLVPREAIEYIIANPHNPLRGFREEKLAIYSEDLRESYFRQKAIAANMLEQERALIRQFRNKGYAVDYSEAEVTDDEQDNCREEEEAIVVD